MTGNGDPRNEEYAMGNWAMGRWKNKGTRRNQEIRWSKVNGQRSMVNGQRSMVNGQRSMVNGLQSTVNGLQSTVNGLQSTVNGQQSMEKGDPEDQEPIGKWGNDRQWETRKWRKQVLSNRGNAPWAIEETSIGEMTSGKQLVGNVEATSGKRGNNQRETGYEETTSGKRERASGKQETASVKWETASGKWESSQRKTV
ncbi:hypothetical protein C8R42DRAFT_639028 [Lentinula raphanica]|nr:hypothetical protein C8R42DRAFT_639028 [Lentinula raphanica]